MLNGKSILITGGTGSLGQKLVADMIEKYPKIKKIIIYSRDELKQYEMAQVFSEQKYPFMRYFIGDVRDAGRLLRACEDVDVIIHAAALKHVPVAEYNPMECINTNIMGAENVINAALDSNVEKVIALSTDKAAAPINLYGATKLCSDKLFIAANNMKGSRKLDFAVVRYGNVMGSRGSVIPFFLKKKSSGLLPITHEKMTRFNITLAEGVDMVMYALEHTCGGEIFVPKIPSYKITDMVEAIAPEAKTEVIGIRPGEKLHEEMITSSDSLNTLDCGKYYVIHPNRPNWNVAEYMERYNAKKVPEGFQYNSGTNSDWVTVEDLRTLIKDHIDPDFKA